MGEDFIFGLVTVPLGEEPLWDSIHEKELKAAARALRRSDAFEESFDTLEEAEDALREDLGALKDAWEDKRRDGSTCIIGAVRCLVTGGMSWGDTPTDLLTSIEHLAEAGLLDALGFDKKVDVPKELPIVLEELRKAGMEKQAAKIDCLFHELYAKLLLK